MKKDHTERKCWNFSWEIRSKCSTFSTCPKFRSTFIFGRSTLLQTISLLLNTPNPRHHHFFNELILKSNTPTVCFTDGSKFHKRSGYAFLMDSSCHSYRYRDSVSIFTSGLQAIHHCLQHILSSTLPPNSTLFLIISDSLYPLTLIRKPSTTHPLITHIHLLLQACKASSIPLTFVRSPSHTNIEPCYRLTYRRSFT